MADQWSLTPAGLAASICEHAFTKTTTMTTPLTSDTGIGATPAATLPLLAERGLALTHVALLGASELTRLIAETHATVRRTPLPWKPDATAPAEQAPLPYQLVMKAFLMLAQTAQSFLKAHQAHPAGREWGLFRSALNGVAGDALSAWNNPLDAGMTLHNEFGVALTAEEWVRQSRRGAVLFIHGVCLSEQEWQTFHHAGFVRELREDGHGVAWLRYNSGRPIHENGAALSALLESAGGGKGPGITLIGHSMGGLVIRAACHQGRLDDSRWLSRLRHAAYLGTPHQGAPLERLGHGANSLLALTPYTKPFMKLGNLRSAGIMDLRHGRVTPPEHEHPVMLVDHARHLLLAAHFGRDGKRHWLGDGLVPVRSALGQHVETDKALSGKHVTRVELAGLGHLALLSDERVYSALREWLRAH